MFRKKKSSPKLVVKDGDESHGRIRKHHLQQIQVNGRKYMAFTGILSRIPAHTLSDTVVLRWFEEFY